MALIGLGGSISGSGTTPGIGNPLSQRAIKKPRPMNNTGMNRFSQAKRGFQAGPSAMGTSTFNSIQPQTSAPVINPMAGAINKMGSQMPQFDPSILNRSPEPAINPMIENMKGLGSIPSPSPINSTVGLEQIGLMDPNKYVPPTGGFIGGDMVNKLSQPEPDIQNQLGPIAQDAITPDGYNKYNRRFRDVFGG